MSKIDKQNVKSYPECEPNFFRVFVNVKVLLSFGHYVWHMLVIGFSKDSAVSSLPSLSTQNLVADIFVNKQSPWSKMESFSN